MPPIARWCAHDEPPARGNRITMPHDVTARRPTPHHEYGAIPRAELHTAQREEC
jgi:hypothetical protein